MVVFTMQKPRSSSSPTRVRSLVGRSALALIVAIGLLPSSAAAQVIMCSEASLAAAVAAGGNYTFRGCAVQAGQEFPLFSEHIVATDLSISFAGPGGGGDWVAQLERVFYVLPGATLELENLTLVGGSPPGDGGVILNEGTLILRGMRLIGGEATHGGGVANFGVATIEDSTLANNVAIFGNGGGLYGAPGSTTTLRRSTVSANQALANAPGVGLGGGVYSAGSLVVENVTISGNESGSRGGGLFVAGSAADIGFSTFAFNRVNGAPSSIDGSVSPSVEGSLLADPCAVAVSSGGYNLESPGDSCGFGAPSDTVDVSVSALDLSPLELGAGRTAVHALGPSSAARDAGPATGCPASDQRGATRPDVGRGIACDVGAFEDSRIGLRDVALRVASGDADPRGGSVLERFEIVARSGDQVAFLGEDSLGERSIYLHDGTSMMHIAGASTPVPGLPPLGRPVGTFTFTDGNSGLSTPLHFAASDGLFAFHFDLPPIVPRPPPPQDLLYPEMGIYLFSATQPVTRCAGVGDVTTTGDPYPGNAAVRDMDLFGGQVVFPGFGLLACDGTTFETLIPSETVLPSGDRERWVIDPLAGVHHDADGTLFEGQLRVLPTSGPEVRFDRGIHEYDSLLGPVRRSDLVTSGSGLSDFGFIDDELLVADSATSTPFGTVGGRILVDDGATNREAGVARAGPGHVTVDNGVAHISPVTRTVSFISPDPLPCLDETVLASTMGGVLETHLASQSTLDGKTIDCLLAGSHFVDGDQIAFAAWFTDGSQGVYTARVPEPSFVAPLLLGVACVAGFGASSARTRGLQRGRTIERATRTVD